MLNQTLYGTNRYTLRISCDALAYNAISDTTNDCIEFKFELDTKYYIILLIRLFENRLIYNLLPPTFSEYSPYRAGKWTSHRIDRILTLFGKINDAYDEYRAYGDTCMDCTVGYSKEELEDM
ncbi:MULTISPECIES: hypothetical protein [Sphingobacterium]|uniref:Uncharacterized protein n=1 Tax=Sphingobacterium ginsenosidimutans TaxID=687845 RepID=A0ABP7ZX09_9SPHI|nr:hypothetical protein [Sphingobacterium sp. E70]ULT29023.1 hypothetical protein KUH03_29735 [Sphingobacterium sp. E70]